MPKMQVTARVLALSINFNTTVRTMLEYVNNHQSGFKIRDNSIVFTDRDFARNFRRHKAQMNSAQVELQTAQQSLLSRATEAINGSKTELYRGMQSAR